MARNKSGKYGISPKEYTVFVLAAGALVLLDQLTKYLVVRALPLNTGEVIIRGFLNLVHIHNPGGAFSIFAGHDSEWKKPIFILLTLVVVSIIFYAYGKVSRGDWWNRAAYIGVFSGAIGNLIDRIRMGEVIDFIDFYAGDWHWPAFNVADCAISIGAVMLLISLLRGK